LANIKSAKKRINVTAKKTIRNKMIRSRTKTAIKKVYTAADLHSDEARAALSAAVSSIDRAASKGVLHKNTASRKKSRLARMVNKLSH